MAPSTVDPALRLPKVMIIGAGLGGLTLALLLERAGVDYQVFERSKTVRTLGSATSLTPNVLPLLEQLGLLPEIEAMSKVVTRSEIYTEEMTKIGAPDITEYKAVCGYNMIIMTRPELHRLLLSRVPAQKILMNKRVLSIQQNELGVIIRTSDNMTHDADILVGADGAYSAVRQGLYKLMKDDGILPSVDQEELKVCHMSILGTTKALDEKEYPVVAEETSSVHSVIGTNKPHTWRYFTVPGRRICWRVDVQTESSSFALNDTFRNSEWGSSESSQSIEEDWRGFRLPIGGTIGDLIDASPIENISKVMLEEKLHQTWYNGRTVLMGDACHKMLPNAGRGAVNAILDAVVLANAIYEIVDATPERIKAGFKQYYEERFPLAKADLAASQQAAKLVAGQRWSDALARKVVFGFMPNFMQHKMYAKSLSYRPQASFLPMVEKRGHGPVTPQKPSKRYMDQQAQAAVTVPAGVAATV